jgi:DNA-binding transcriptional LysR family regulator
MELRQLQTFVTIVRYMNFTRAADELGYAQSTVTTQIKNLEEYYGVLLFERMGRKIHLTEYGRTLLPVAREIIRLNERANTLLSQQDHLKGVIRVATPESLCVKWFPRVYKKLIERHPDIELDVITFDRRDYEDMLRNNEVDLSFSIEYEAVHLDFTILSELPMEMNLVAAKNHPLCQQETVSINDLNNQKFVFTEKGYCYRVIIDSFLEKNSILPKEVLTMKNLSVIKELICNGYGISYLPEFALSDEIEKNQLAVIRGINIDTQFKTVLLCHQEKWISPGMQAFIDIVKTEVP